MSAIDFSSIISNTGQASASSAQAGSTSISQTDFLRLLIAQMSSPNLDSLFSSGSDDQSSSSFFGSNSSLFGSSNTLLSGALGLGGSGTSSSLLGLGSNSAVELSIYSNLIGKDVESFDSSTSKTIKGKVNSVVLQNSVAMLDIGSNNLVKPSTLVRVK